MTTKLSISKSPTARPGKKRASAAEISREQILASAEEILRRFGPEKATVVDVARMLGVSHGNVYRYFVSKSDLINSVVEIWLKRLANNLRDILSEDEAVRVRLKRWLLRLLELKMTQYEQESQLFATYHHLLFDSEAAVSAYYIDLVGQIEALIQCGIDNGEVRDLDVARTARAIFDATIRFHHPWHAAYWHGTQSSENFENIWQLIERSVFKD